MSIEIRIEPISLHSEPSPPPISLPGYEILTSDTRNSALNISVSQFPVLHFPGSTVPESTVPESSVTESSVTESNIAESSVTGSKLSVSDSPITLEARNRDTGHLVEIRYYPFPSFAYLESKSENKTENKSEDSMRQTWQQSVVVWQKTLSKLCQMDAHPNIQRVLDYGKTDTGLYIVLENLEGRTLRETLETEGARTLEWTLAISTQIASALDFVAANQLAHGALNPDNLLLDNVTGTVKLRNVGLPMLAYNGSSVRQTTAYTSPEQVSGHEGDSLSDVYAFGAILYSCLSGRAPYTATNSEELAHKILTGAPLPLLAQPTWVRDIILRAMQRGSDYRYRVAVDIVTDLTFQRSPAPLSLDAALSHGRDDKDWSLGKYMPALALKEEAGDAFKEGRRGWFGRRSGGDANGEKSPGILALLLALFGFGAKRGEGTARTGGGAAGSAGPTDDMPIDGMLGRFNRYMALQEYVLLDPNDPRWKDIKGWRAFLFRFGIRVPVPVRHVDTSRPPRRLIPWAIQRRFARAVGRGARIICILVPLFLLAMCIHAGIRVHQHGKAWVVNIKGNPTVVRQGKKVPLHAGDVLDGVDMPTLSTDSKSELSIQMADSSIHMAPDTTLKLAQMDYTNGARARRLELVTGRAMMRVEPQAEQEMPGHYDLAVQDTQVRALASNSPLLMVINYRKGKSKVTVGQGSARVLAKGKRKFLRKAEEIDIQGDATLDNPMPIPTHDRNLLTLEFAKLLPATKKSPVTPVKSSRDANPSPMVSPSVPASVLHPMIAHWVELYTGVQEKTVMPLMERAMTLAHLKPETQSALDEAKALATARISLDGLVKALVANEMPATLNLKTLEEIGLEEKDRNRMLESFAEHRLLGYRKLENGSCLLLARANNESRTMLEAHDGIIRVVPEAEEDAEAKKFQ